VSTDDETDKPSTSGDETRRKFQEALDRKRNREGHGGAPRDPNSSMLAHESKKRQRTFRRKSG
jgi:hypothetical protein